MSGSGHARYRINQGIEMAIYFYQVIHEKITIFIVQPMDHEKGNYF
jgi:hypothetical protein